MFRRLIFTFFTPYVFIMSQFLVLVFDLLFYVDHVFFSNQSRVDIDSSLYRRKFYILSKDSLAVIMIITDLSSAIHFAFLPTLSQGRLLRVQNG